MTAASHLAPDGVQNLRIDEVRRGQAFGCQPPAGIAVVEESQHGG